jgi:hypothetical protein
VRSEISSRTFCASIAMMPTVKRSALGMSQATKSTSAFCSPERKWASRDKRSSFAMIGSRP